MNKYNRVNKPAKIISQVHIGELAEGNQCVTRVDNQVIFVADAVPGDWMDIELTKQKKGYALAVPIKLHKPGAARVQAFCSHFGTCGGCTWQQVDYATQLAAKEQQVREKFIRLGHIENPPIRPIIGAHTTQHYRNKLEFTFSNRRWLTTEEIQSGTTLDRRCVGFHKPSSFDKIVNITNCYLQAEPSNAIRNTIAQFAKEQDISFYDIITNQGFLRNLIIRTTSTGQVMVILQVGQPDTARINQIMAYIHAQFPALTSLQYVVNTKRNETFHDLPIHCYAGQSFITETIAGLTWRIGPKSFFQTNTAQAAILYQTVLALAELTGNETVYDLYTGVGTMAHLLARAAHQVVGVDIIPEAIEDARMNASLNNLHNVSFYAGDMKDFIPILMQTNPYPDVIVTDPPRAGMHATVIEALLQLSPKKIIYVSCNPATQARDLQMLQVQYTLVQSQPIDLFPHTSHVENVALLLKKDL